MSTFYARVVTTEGIEHSEYTEDLGAAERDAKVFADVESRIAHGVAFATVREFLGEPGDTTVEVFKFDDGVFLSRVAFREVAFLGVS